MEESEHLRKAECVSIFGGRTFLYPFHGLADRRRTDQKDLKRQEICSMRHVSRTHRVDLDWLFDKINTMQIADIPTKRCFIRERWVKLITLLMMMTPSENVCSRVPNDMNLQRLQARCAIAALNWPFGNQGCPRKTKLAKQATIGAEGHFWR